MVHGLQMLKTYPVCAERLCVENQMPISARCSTKRPLRDLHDVKSLPPLA